MSGLEDQTIYGIYGDIFMKTLALQSAKLQTWRKRMSNASLPSEHPFDRMSQIYSRLFVDRNVPRPTSDKEEEKRCNVDPTTVTFFSVGRHPFLVGFSTEKKTRK